MHKICSPDSKTNITSSECIKSAHAFNFYRYEAMYLKEPISPEFSLQASTFSCFISGSSPSKHIIDAERTSSGLASRCSSLSSETNNLQGSFRHQQSREPAQHWSSGAFNEQASGRVTDWVVLIDMPILIAFWRAEHKYLDGLVFSVTVTSAQWSFSGGSAISSSRHITHTRHQVINNVVAV